MYEDQTIFGTHERKNKIWHVVSKKKCFNKNWNTLQMSILSNTVIDTEVHKYE